MSAPPCRCDICTTVATLVDAAHGSWDAAKVSPFAEQELRMTATLLAAAREIRTVYGHSTTPLVPERL